MTRRQTNITAHVLLILVNMVWGTTFSLVKLALRDSTPLAFNLVRMALAVAVLAAINWTALRGLSQQDLRYGALAGFFLGIGYQFQTAGLAHTTAAKSAFITGLIVVIVPLLAVIPGIAPPGHHRPGLPAFFGALTAFAGLIFLTTPPGSGAAIFSGIGLGELLTLACAFAYAGHLLTLARAAPTMPARRLGTLQIGFCTLTMLVTLPVGGTPHIRFTALVLIALAVTALLATAAAFTIQSWAQQHLPASHTALIFTTEPIFAWLFSLVFLHEHLGSRSLLGAALILSGILLAELAAIRSTPPNSALDRGILPNAEQ